MNSSRSGRVSCFVCDSQNTRCRVVISALRTHYTAMHSTSNKLDAKRMKGQKNNGGREEQERKNNATHENRTRMNKWLNDGWRCVCLWDFLWCWFLLTATHTHTRNPPDWHDQRHLAITTPLDWSPLYATCSAEKSWIITGRKKKLCKSTSTIFPQVVAHCYKRA